MKFKLKSTFKPTGDQPEAIQALVDGINKGFSHQVLLGVTGSGKTFTMANVIERLQRPTLVISHNKTLAAQLYQEFRDFFPKNAVSYFVSYYDYYQPEAYIPQTDTYIEKEADINEKIDKLRLQATANLMTRPDVIVVASVSCIYNIGSPIEYGRYVLDLSAEQKTSRKEVLKRLVELHYRRGDFDFDRGTFRVRGEAVEIYPAYNDERIRIVLSGEHVSSIEGFNPVTGKVLQKHKRVILYPAKHYMVAKDIFTSSFEEIRQDLKERLKILRRGKKLLEAQRLEQRVNYDLEMIQEMGYVNGIENYSRYFDGRTPGEPPYTLLDYFSENKRLFGKNFLTIIDESHMTVPQIGGMYEGDSSRKDILIAYGFRLPSCKDNRPLKFPEFLERVDKVIYTSATPSPWETKKSRRVVEQLIRPTGLLDPEIFIRPTKNQIDDLINEIKRRKKRRERVLVTTLTKRMAEDLAEYLKESKNYQDGALKEAIKVHYLHSDIETLKRSDILDDLRLGKYEVLVGINLLREGLDLPEVSLVAILDADKEGFLRSETALIQTMGRAARHLQGSVIMYADNLTGSMKRAIAEVNRRREIQVKYNLKHGITPQTIKKPVREKLVEADEAEERITKEFESLLKINFDELTPYDRKLRVKKMEKEMRSAAKNLEFEKAAKIRDLVATLSG